MCGSQNGEARPLCVLHSTVSNCAPEERWDCCIALNLDRRTFSDLVKKLALKREMTCNTIMPRHCWLSPSTHRDTLPTSVYVLNVSSLLSALLQLRALTYTSLLYIIVLILNASCLATVFSHAHLDWVFKPKETYIGSTMAWSQHSADLILEFWDFTFLSFHFWKH